MTSLIECAWLILGLIHFGAPLTYYYYLSRKLSEKPWDIEINKNKLHLPEITVVVPTYNEETLIEKRLDNIYEQDYPKDKLKIIVIDSASNDQTVELARRWAERHKDIKLKIVEEPVRRGKPRALNKILPIIDTDILVVTDADSLWFKDSLKKAVNFLANPDIGVVSGIKTPMTPRGDSPTKEIEETYRTFYNKIRVYESKIHSTPIIAGELFAVKKDILTNVGGFDLINDDSYTAMKIVSKGYRAIVSDDVKIIELAPVTMKSYRKWKITRAQHLIHNFVSLIKCIRRYPSQVRKIITIEAFFHLLNPWILLSATVLFMISMIGLSLISLLTILVLTSLLLHPKTGSLLKTWITEQLLLISAAIKNLRTKSEVWEKIEEVRTTVLTSQRSV